MESRSTRAGLVFFFTSLSFACGSSSSGGDDSGATGSTGAESGATGGSANLGGGSAQTGGNAALGGNGASVASSGGSAASGTGGAFVGTSGSVGTGGSSLGTGGVMGIGGSSTGAGGSSAISSGGTSSVGGAGGSPVTGSGGSPVTGSGGSPVTGSGGSPVTGSGGRGANTGGSSVTGAGGSIGSGGRGANTGGSAGGIAGGMDAGGNTPGTGGAAETTGGVDAGGAPAGGAGTGGTSTVTPEGEMPPVYDTEDTGADCPEPTMPAFSALPSIESLPDPFLKADGTPITTQAEWRCRRAEIKAMLEHWDVGEKPGKPSTFEPSLQGNTLSIEVGEGSNRFTMTATIARPAGAPSGPIPAIIGINTPTGSLPSAPFSTRGIASITYDSAQLAPSGFSGGGSRTDGNFYALYPGATAGYMIRWAWGISRIIDALQALPEANIDVSHLAVSGCSYQGKIALYAGAFDERIALTIPHESGGGGTISWRYSDMLEDRDHTEVENLHHALGAPWYADAVAQFADSPDQLPFDHHELIGMIAPRAVLAIESSQIARMGAEAARVDALAAREIWTALGVPYRMGATEENTGHCVWHDGFTPALEAYLDAFLLDQEDADTDVLRSQFTAVDTDTWIPWETPTLQ